VKLTCLRGYSGSGKSTKAAQIAEETGAVIVNRDQLRKMLLNSWWTGDKADEDRVTLAEEASVKALLRAGVGVVVDATHLEPRYLRKWARLASRFGAEFEVVDCRNFTPVGCILNDQRRGEAGERFVGQNVIIQQAKRYPMNKWPEIKADPPFIVEPVEPIAGIPPAIIADIDGTVAHIPEGGRSPYDYSRVSEDLPDPAVIQIVRQWKWFNPLGIVLFVSGRDDACYDVTLAWLEKWRIPVDYLFMRPTGALDIHGGKQPDYIVKYDLFNKHIRGRFDVQFVLDDRDQVVDVWRRLGLKCLQVAPGDF
jgi:predicted kinase